MIVLVKDRACACMRSCSAASDEVKPFRPCFVAAYTELKGVEALPAIDDTLTTTPLFRASIAGSAARVKAPPPASSTCRSSTTRSSGSDGTDPRAGVGALAAGPPTAAPEEGRDGAGFIASPGIGR